MDDELERPGGSRRDFLRKSVVVGAAVWTAPAVVSLPGGKAWAQQYPECNCNADAYGLRVIIPPLTFDQTFGVGGCLADTGTLGSAAIATVLAKVVCGEASSSVNGVCSADANVDKLLIKVGNPATLTVQATVLQTSAAASCSPCATAGNFSILALKVNNVNVNLTSACNFHPLGLPGVVVNEQTCVGDTLTVNALHVTVPGIIEVIVAHSEAGATGCGCSTC